MSEVIRKVTVPDGQYCEDNNRHRCEMFYTEFSHIGWEDGLGSPGTLALDRCRLFNAVLGEEKVGEQYWTKKCSKCKEAQANSGGR